MSRRGVRIRCNLGGCWLECDRCGVLDQGDSPASMERMKRTEQSHVCPLTGGSTPEPDSATDQNAPLDQSRGDGS